MFRRTALLASAALALAAAPHAGAAAFSGSTATSTARSTATSTAKPAAKVPVVTLIDTGVNPRHQEFDYRGRSSTTDQFVGWWDFSAEKKGKNVLPAPGQAWDTQVTDPYDKVGHGTLTAGMAGGRNASSTKTPSAFPGVKLAIAKVSYYAGSATDVESAIDLDMLAPAVRWAVDTVHTDVVSISIGSSVPLPSSLNAELFDALHYARQHGVLVVVSNGNGWGDLGVLPGDPGWASNFGASPDALSVGAAGSAGLINSTDPEVTAVYSIVGPSNTDNKGYVSNGGTSFGTPYVAGFAAAVLYASRQGGHPLGVDALEQFVKDASSDTVYPPQVEGYGTLNQDLLPGALANARAGKLPTRPSPDYSALYVDGVVGTLRTLWVTAT